MSQINKDRGKQTSVDLDTMQATPVTYRNPHVCYHKPAGSEHIQFSPPWTSGSEGARPSTYARIQR